MNWYKLIKVSFPLVNPESHQYKTHMDIGHAGYGYAEEFLVPYPGKLTPITLWFVDDNFNIHTWDKSSVWGHCDWNEYFEHINNLLATGRYDKEKKVVSMRIFYSDFPGRKSFLRNRIVRMLDDKFNNPAIVEF